MASATPVSVHEHPPSEPVAASPPTQAEAASVNGEDTPRPAQEQLTDTLTQLVDWLSNALKNALDSSSSLEVSTFISDDMEGVDYDPKTHTFTGTAKLRALTRISFTGDVSLCLPEKEGKIDQDIWAIHAKMVEQAQAQRTEMLKALVPAATELLKVAKPRLEAENKGA